MSVSWSISINFNLSFSVDFLCWYILTSKMLKESLFYLQLPKKARLVTWKDVSTKLENWWGELALIIVSKLTEIQFAWIDLVGVCYFVLFKGTSSNSVNFCLRCTRTISRHEKIPKFASFRKKIPKFASFRKHLFIVCCKTILFNS